MICFAYILYANYIPVGNIVIKILAMYKWFVIRFLEICKKKQNKKNKKKAFSLSKFRWLHFTILTIGKLT